MKPKTRVVTVSSTINCLLTFRKHAFKIFYDSEAVDLQITVIIKPSIHVSFITARMETA